MASPTEEETIQILRGHQGPLREVPPRELPGRGPRGGRLPVEPLHHRPLPSRQGHRPPGRGGQPREAPRRRRPRGGSPSSRGRSGWWWTAPSASERGRLLPRRGGGPAREPPHRPRALGHGRPRHPRGHEGRTSTTWSRSGRASPSTAVKEEESAKLLRMEEELHRRIVSQENAISAVARAIRRTRAGLKNPNRPVGSFLFLGPTGVGKTEVARSLAAFLFGSERTPGALRHVGVHGEALRVQAHRLAAGVRGPRRGRTAHRAREAEPLFGGAPRRDREGPPRRLQHPPPGLRGRPPDGRPRQHHRLQERDPHHDLQHRGPLHREEGADGVHLAGRPGDTREAAWARW